MRKSNSLLLSQTNTCLILQITDVGLYGEEVGDGFVKAVLTVGECGEDGGHGDLEEDETVSEVKFWVILVECVIVCVYNLMDFGEDIRNLVGLIVGDDVVVGVVELAGDVQEILE
jgi:hypothetical protein